MAGSTTETDPVDTLANRLRERAQSLALSVSDANESTALQQRDFRTASMASSIDALPENHSKRPHIPHLDAQRPGILIGHYAVLISTLGMSVSKASQWYHAAEYHAAAALTWLSGKYREDLHLFLVGPWGSNDDPDWSALASRIERDERICRKLVWLPSQTQPLESADFFLERTFLARPWAAITTPGQPRLDPIEEVVKELCSRPDLKNTPQTVIRKWLNTLTQLGEVSDVVTPLMRALEEETKP